MLQQEYDDLNNKLNSLKNRRDRLKEKLKSAEFENDIIEYKYEIMKLDERIPSLEEKVDSLKDKIYEENQKRLKEEREKQRLKEQEEKKEFLFKKLYVTLSDEELDQMKEDFGLQHFEKENAIRHLIDHNSTFEINDLLILFKVLSVPELERLESNIKNNNVPINKALEKYNKHRIFKKMRPKYKEKVIAVEEYFGVFFNGFCGGTFNFIVEINENYDEFYWNGLHEYTQEMFIERVYDGNLPDDYDLDRVLSEVPISELRQWYFDNKYEDIDEFIEGIFPFDFDVIEIKRKFIKPESKKFKNRNGMLYVDGWNSKLSIGDCNELMALIDSNGGWPSILQLLNKFPNVSSKYYDIIAENYAEFLEFLEEQ